jgi:molybdate transport system substrate-binding protein
VRLRATAALLVPAVAAGGCAGDGGDELTVFAAASLTDAFTELAQELEAREPGSAVALNVGPSSGLATQITEGAPADVFAPAGPAPMETVVDAGVAGGEPEDFATNLLELAVPPGNPGAVEGVADLGRDELVVALCAGEVPCGQYGRQLLDQAGVRPAVDSEEPDVAALVTKVAAGEVDAGIVYRSDVEAAEGEIEGIEIPEEDNVVATYPIVVLADAGEPDLARSFVELVQSDEGQAILHRYGFRAL